MDPIVISITIKHFNGEIHQGLIFSEDLLRDIEVIEAIYVNVSSASSGRSSFTYQHHLNSGETEEPDMIGSNRDVDYWTLTVNNNFQHSLHEELQNRQHIKSERFLLTTRSKFFSAMELKLQPYVQKNMSVKTAVESLWNPELDEGTFIMLKMNTFTYMLLYKKRNWIHRVYIYSQMDANDKYVVYSMGPNTYEFDSLRSLVRYHQTQSQSTLMVKLKKPFQSESFPMHSEDDSDDN